jgi:holo-[acyl-carrier protein] synthase
MIIGVGTDIVSTKRIGAILGTYKDKFINRILSKREVDVFLTISQVKKFSYLAKRFAAKEAFAKALGTGIGEKISFNEIEIINDNMGKPDLKIIPIKADLVKDYHIKLSIADENDYAIAFVVISLNSK